MAAERASQTELRRQCEARKNTFAIRQNGASSASALIATLLRSGDAKAFSQHVQ